MDFVYLQVFFEKKNILFAPFSEKKPRQLDFQEPLLLFTRACLFLFLLW